MNRLFYGDNLDILPRYVKDEAVDLVYLDPPFNSQANYKVLFAEHGAMCQTSSSTTCVTFAHRSHGTRFISSTQNQHVASKYRADHSGRLYTLSDMTSPHPRPNMMYDWKGHKSPVMGWRYSKDTMRRLDADGRIFPRLYQQTIMRASLRNMNRAGRLENGSPTDPVIAALAATELPQCRRDPTA